MTEQTMPFVTTSSFIKKWNKITDGSEREELLKSHLGMLFIKRDMNNFLYEFTNQFSFRLQLVKRIRILLLCRRIIAQNPPRVDKTQPHYKLFREEYDFDIAYDTSVDPVRWLNEELNYFRGLKMADEEFKPYEVCKTNLDGNIATSDTPPANNLKLMIKKEAAEALNISESTFDRRLMDGLPCDRVGSKFRLDTKAVLEWMAANKPKKIQLSIVKNKKGGGRNHVR